MYRIHQLNKISAKGTELLTADYMNTDCAENADGILVRSANMHEMTFSDDLLAVAESQLGYRESAANYILDDEGNKLGYTRYGHWYGDHHGHY